MIRDRFDVAAQHCADLGLDIVWRDLGPKTRGLCHWREGHVVLNPRMTQAQAAATLIHEVGHAEFGDDASTPPVERRAWEYGASLLIGQGEYAVAEQLVGCSPSALALELDTTPRIIESWRRWWKRRGHLDAGHGLEGV